MVSSVGVEEAPKAGAEEVPNAGVEEGAPNAGIAEGAPKLGTDVAGAEDKPPAEGKVKALVVGAEGVEEVAVGEMPNGAMGVDADPNSDGVPVAVEGAAPKREVACGAVAAKADEPAGAVSAGGLNEIGPGVESDRGLAGSGVLRESAGVGAGVVVTGADDAKETVLRVAGIEGVAVGSLAKSVVE